MPTFGVRAFGAVVGAVIAAMACGTQAAGKTEKAGTGEAGATLAATLSKEQIREFSAMVRNRNLRREEVAVTLRIGAEKQRELKGFLDELQKEFGMRPDCAYAYEIESKSLFQLSTNKLDKAGQPERKLIRKMKSDSESQYVSRLLVARKLTENQIQVLAQLRAEKTKEAQLMDNRLRQTFKLDPDAGYRLDEQTGKVFRLPAPDKAEGAGRAGAAARPADAKAAKGKE